MCGHVAAQRHSTGELPLQKWSIDEEYTPYFSGWETPWVLTGRIDGVTFYSAGRRHDVPQCRSYRSIKVGTG